MKKHLKSDKKILSLQHLDLSQSYNNIARVYYNTGNYSKTFSLLERAVDICQRLLLENHPHLQYVQNGIEMAKKENVNKIIKK
jgi:tetratricopeptide (TPR) repeat protein